MSNKDESVGNIDDEKLVMALTSVRKSTISIFSIEIDRVGRLVDTYEEVNIVTAEDALGIRGALLSTRRSVIQKVDALCDEEIAAFRRTTRGVTGEGLGRIIEALQERSKNVIEELFDELHKIQERFFGLIAPPPEDSRKNH